MEPAPTNADTPLPPAHIAIIMDGNGRWAKARGLPRTAGHKRGAESVRRTVEAARDMGVSYMTLYGFSSENWNRPVGEVTDLMGLLRLYLRNEVNSLHKNGIRLRVIGDRKRLGPIGGNCDMSNAVAHCDRVGDVHVLPRDREHSY